MPTQQRPQVHPRRRPAWSVLSRLRRRPVAWWLATLALAAVTAQVVSGAVSRAEEGAARYGTVRSVLVVTSDVPAGALLTASDAEVRDLPATLVAEGAVGADALGQRVTSPLLAGEVVHRARLAPGGLSPVAALLPPGTRGVAVPSGLDTVPLEVGDVVDVLATVVTAAPGEGGDEAPTVTVAARALVVDGGEQATTLAVPAEEAAQVAYAATSGIVTLALVGG